MRCLVCFCGLFWGLASMVQAQTLNCSNPITQAEMTGCAAQFYEAADADLNAIWPAAKATARNIDQAYLPAGQPRAVDLLVDAQRAWITYRDAACTAESLVARGGTMQNQLFYGCLARLTRQRTEDLMTFSNDF